MTERASADQPLPPSPTSTGARLSPEQIHQRLESLFPDAGLTFEGGNIPSTIVPREHLVAVAQALRDDPAFRFDYPGDVTAIDYLDYFELVYQLRSFTYAHDVTLKCRVDRGDAVAPSLVPIWPGADFQEREVYDMFGIVFTGHPNLSRILLWDEFEGHPLRKDWGIPAPMPAEVALAMRMGSTDGWDTGLAAVDQPASPPIATPDPHLAGDGVGDTMIRRSGSGEQ